MIQKLREIRYEMHLRGRSRDKKIESKSDRSVSNIATVMKTLVQICLVC